MISRWVTHRGDEWYYSSGNIEAVGWTNNTFIEVSLKQKQSRLTEDLLIKFLQEANNEFKEDYQILLCLDNELKQLIVSLAVKGFLNWELVQHPLSQSARITYLYTGEKSEMKKTDSNKSFWNKCITYIKYVVAICIGIF